MGDLLLSMHRNPEAMDRFETVLAITRTNSDARRGELAAASELALTAGAPATLKLLCRCLQHARIELTDDPDLLLELGIQATELYLYPEAEEALECRSKAEVQTIPAFSTRSPAWKQNGSICRPLKPTFGPILPRNPMIASAHFGLGHILAMQQRTDDARAEFERSIQLQPVQTESYYQIGEIELDAHQDAKARALFHKTLERDPTHGGRSPAWVCWRSGPKIMLKPRNTSRLQKRARQTMVPHTTIVDWRWPIWEGKTREKPSFAKPPNSAAQTLRRRKYLHRLHEIH